jgi:hypothetical protein
VSANQLTVYSARPAQSLPRPSSIACTSASPRTPAGSSDKVQPLATCFAPQLTGLGWARRAGRAQRDCAAGRLGDAPNRCAAQWLRAADGRGDLHAVQPELCLTAVSETRRLQPTISALRASFTAPFELRSEAVLADPPRADCALRNAHHTQVGRSGRAHSRRSRFAAEQSTRRCAGGRGGA